MGSSFKTPDETEYIDEPYETIRDRIAELRRGADRMGWRQESARQGLTTFRGQILTGISVEWDRKVRTEIGRIYGVCEFLEKLTSLAWDSQLHMKSVHVRALQDQALEILEDITIGNSGFEPKDRIVLSWQVDQ